VMWLPGASFLLSIVILSTVVLPYYEIGSKPVLPVQSLCKVVSGLEEELSNSIPPVAQVLSFATKACKARGFADDKAIPITKQVSSWLQGANSLSITFSTMSWWFLVIGMILPGTGIFPPAVLAWQASVLLFSLPCTTAQLKEGYFVAASCVLLEVFIGIWRWLTGQRRPVDKRDWVS